MKRFAIVFFLLMFSGCSMSLFHNKSASEKFFDDEKLTEKKSDKKMLKKYREILETLTGLVDQRSNELSLALAIYSKENSKEKKQALSMNFLLLDYENDEQFSGAVQKINLIEAKEQKIEVLKDRTNVLGKAMEDIEIIVQFLDSLESYLSEAERKNVINLVNAKMEGLYLKIPVLFERVVKFY